jgi:hypothetical protein
VLTHIVQKMLYLVGGPIDVRRVAIDLPDEPQVKRMGHQALWKSDAPRLHESRRQLCGAVASRLLLPNGYVCFHFDADCTWEDARASTANLRRFNEKILVTVRAFVNAELSKVDRTSEIETTMARLVLLVPHYSIEAWLYQNVAVARAECERRNCGKHQVLFNEWERDRSLLDEVSRPKEATCFRDAINVRLAEGLPAARVRDAQKSFHASVLRMTHCAELVDALRTTRSA